MLLFNQFRGDGSYYSGEFVNNEIEGIGLYKWCDGREYNG